MTICADTSFILKLLLREEGSEAAKEAYGRFKQPKLPFSLFQRMEVNAAISQKLFFSKQDKKRKYPLEQDASRARGQLQTFLDVSLLVDTPIPWEECFQFTLGFLPKYSEQFGCRTLDMIHIGIAKYLGAEWFLTFDKRQAKAADSEGLRVELLGG